MKFIWYLPVLFWLCSCSRHQEASFAMSLNKEAKLQSLQKKISKAEAEQQKAERKLKQLEIKFYAKNLEIIERRITEFAVFRKRLEKKPGLWRKFIGSELNRLFLQERKALVAIIEKCPQMSLHAEHTLNKILQIITELSQKDAAAKF